MDKIVTFPSLEKDLYQAFTKTYPKMLPGRFFYHEVHEGHEGETKKIDSRCYFDSFCHLFPFYFNFLLLFFLIFFVSFVCFTFTYFDGGFWTIFIVYFQLNKWYNMT